MGKWEEDGDDWGVGGGVGVRWEGGLSTRGS